MKTYKYRTLFGKGSIDGSAIILNYVGLVHEDIEGQIRGMNE